MDVSIGLKGTKILAELREFANFRRQTQQFICQSLDIAFYPDLPIKNWARDDQNAESIAAQKQVYQALPGIRSALPHSSAGRCRSFPLSADRGVGVRYQLRPDREL